MDKIWDRKSFEVGSHWPLWRGWKKLNDHAEPTSRKLKIIIKNPLHYLLILILEKEPVFLFSMLSAKQGNHWYHFYKSLVWRQHSTTRLSRRGTIKV